jgi:hypothetical protein
VSLTVVSLPPRIGWRSVLTHVETTYIGLMLGEAREEHRH